MTIASRTTKVIALATVCILYTISWILVTSTPCMRKNDENMINRKNIVLRNQNFLLDCKKGEEDIRGKPKTSILFLKTHKTAGSTVQNILMRFAKKHRLTVALPQNNLHTLAYPKTFMRAFQDGDLHYSRDGLYDVICHHTRYDQTMSNLLPNDTIYISILRDPALAFESYFRYFDIGSNIAVTGSNGTQDEMEYFLDMSVKMKKGFHDLKLCNLQLYDFGMEFDDAANVSKVQEKIKEIDNKFHLIMIAEYFDESLILLKKILNWKIEDLVYFKHNIRINSLRKPLDQKVLNKIRKFNTGDMELYKYFNNSFWKRIKKQCQETFKKDINALQKLNHDLDSYCVSGYEERHEASSRFQAGFGETYAFRLKDGAKNNNTCIAMTTSEISFTHIMRQDLLSSGQLKFNKIGFP